MDIRRAATSNPADGVMSWAGETSQAHIGQVLLVENEPALASTYAEPLIRAGFAVDVAANGWEALRHMEQTLPDVVVLELHLPILSGLRLIQLLKQEPLTRSIALLVLTRISPQEARAALQAGVDDFLMKPVAPQEIASRVTCLAAQASRRASSRPYPTDGTRQYVAVAQVPFSSFGRSA